MQNNAVPTRSRPALSQGLIFGVIVGVILIIYLIIAYVLYIPTLSLIVGIVAFLIELFLYAFAGYRASAITGKTGTGAIAGLFTGLFGGLIGAVVSVILVIVFVDTTRIRTLSVLTTPSLRQLYTNSFIISTGIGGALLGIGLAIGYGAAAGAIGGVIGKRRAPVQHYQEVLYQGMPPAQGPYQGPYQTIPPMQNPYQQGTFYGQDPNQQGTPPTQNPPPPNNYPGNYQ